MFAWQTDSRSTFEDLVMKRLDDIDRNIKKLNSSGTNFRSVESQKEEAAVISKLSMLGEKIDRLLGGKSGQTIEDRISTMDKQLSNIFNILSGGSENTKMKAEEENVFQEDRKRLKERLKAAVELKDPTSVADRSESWMEYIFGIRQADGRIGKERSRYTWLV